MESADNIRLEFERLGALPDPRRRGRHFEGLIGRLFERAHLRVIVGSQAASPRDADLFASGRDEYLVEVKWQKTPANIDVIEGLWGRLARTPPHVVGVVFSMSGFSRTAIKLVEENRDRPILLVRGDEVARLCDGLALRPLLRHKKWALTVEARVLFAERSPLWPADWPPRRELWPEPDAGVDGPRRWIEGRAGRDPVVFVDELPHVDWTMAQGMGVGFDLQLPLHTQDDLARAFEILYTNGWLTGAGRFRIEQPGRTAWYGWGAAGFLDAIRQQGARLAGQQGWHSEERTDYFDTCPGGWYTLTLRVHTGDKRLFGAHLSAQLAGIPTETTPMRLLAEAFDLDDEAFFRPLTAAHTVHSVPFRQGDVPVEATDFIVAAGDPSWVSGLVVRNPGASRIQDEEVRNLMGDDEFVTCALASWHQVGEVHRYHLRDIESAESGAVRVSRVAADWT